VSEPGNPAELKPALLFGALYALVILAVAFVKDRFGDAGLYPVALLSGMTDVDAITLSTVNLAEAGRLEAKIGARLILLAVLANLAFKGGCAMVLGSAALRARIGGYFGLALAGGVAILVLWRCRAALTRHGSGPRDTMSCPPTIKRPTDRAATAPRPMHWCCN
jgi:uncharacterized membrane protein (DUF4010 family)